MIPNVFHFVFGMAPDFGGKPFSLVHYLAIKSAVELNKPRIAYLHYQYEPEGEWWEKAKAFITLHKIRAPESFKGKQICHVAHKADVVRLQVLHETGGIYIDLDTISVKPLTDLLDHSFVIGQELKIIYKPKNLRQKLKYKFWETMGAYKNGSPVHSGLCNAVLLSEKNSDFINQWMNEYKTFRSKDRDKYWNEHSVQVPEKLAVKNPELITILDHTAFHYPLFNEPGLKSMFEEVHEFPGAYLHHLWESFSWNKYLSKLTVNKILSQDTTYNLIARRFL
jgi:Glycosyltransferase sugar-binding region containing DXD motif